MPDARNVTSSPEAGAGRRRRPPVRRLSARAVALAAAGALLAVGCAPEEADPGPTVAAEELRQTLIRGFETHREMDLEYVRAVPDSALRWAPYPDVRDYAQQIEHIVVDYALFVAKGVLDEELPALGDTAVYLNDKEELERLVEDAHGYALEALRGLPPEELVSETELFDERRPVWSVFRMALDHADWTRGQLVPYLRLNGVEPPAWQAY